MRIKLKSPLSFPVGLLVAILLFALPRLWALTVETEDDSTTIPDTANVKSSSGPEGVEGRAASKRAGIGGDLGFYYFFKAGYVVQDPTQLLSVGKIQPMNDGPLSYSTPKTAYVILDGKASRQVKAGDLLTIYRAKMRFDEERSGFSGYWVQNLAIVKVLEVQQKRCLVQVKETFAPILDGDRARPYEDEISRWKEAQEKKSLPNHPIRCFVASGENPDTRHYWTLSDFIILTAGAKKGIVEGQEFEIRKFENRADPEEALHIPVGTAQVFFVGPNYSMAKILTSHFPVEAGFEAYFTPAGAR